jgi:hypothetical protein
VNSASRSLTLFVGFGKLNTKGKPVKSTRSYASNGRKASPVPWLLYNAILSKPLPFTRCVAMPLSEVYFGDLLCYEQPANSNAKIAICVLGCVKPLSFTRRMAYLLLSTKIYSCVLLPVRQIPQLIG